MTRVEKNLDELLAGVATRAVEGEPGVAVRGLAVDSRLVEPGSLFVALPGQRSDGHAHIADAVGRGAVGAVVSQPFDGPRPGVVVTVDDTAETLARMAAAFYGHPSGELDLIGITGTNGKTTLTYLLEGVMKAAGRSPGVIGTVEVRFSGRSQTTPHTTPQAHTLQALLASMLAAGVDTALLEVSSHGLELQRVRGCQFKVAVFTNLSRDHLDFHGDLDRYAGAKALLFERELTESRATDRVAVVNADDAQADRMVAGWRGRVIRYSLGDGGQVHPVGPVTWDLSGIRARVLSPGGEVQLDSPLTGRHNLENLVAAVAVASGLGLPPAPIAAGLAACTRVPGRLERVETDEGPAVFVDYAHTDHALANALAALRPVTPGRLVVVFGCGGDRDRGKRPLMGRAVAEVADLAVVTSDNPRSEDPQAIIDQILPGLEGQGLERLELDRLGHARRGYSVEPDRRSAIAAAVGLLAEGDVLLIAGKGHETYQLIGGEVLDFDDRLEARRALEARTHGATG